MNDTSNDKLTRCFTTSLIDDGGGFEFEVLCRMKEKLSVYSDLSDALMFTVRSVVKIAQQVPAP